MHDGSTFPDAFRGSDLTCDLATVIRRISALFSGMSWLSDMLGGIGQRVAEHTLAATPNDLLKRRVRHSGLDMAPRADAASDLIS